MIQFDHVVEGLCNLPVDAGQVERQAHAEISPSQRAQRAEQGAATITVPSSDELK